jgi:RHS repeat-associated protein
MSKHIFLGNDRIVTKQVALGTGETYDNADTAVEKLYTYYYHADHLGSTSVVTDHNGEVYERLEYTPYGETWLDETSGNTYFDTPYRFSAKEKDEETGLYYYGARYLDPKYSRWISADPALGDYLPQAPVNDEAKKHNQSLPGQGGVYNVINLNLYHYAGNNPIKYTDPDGKSTLSGIGKVITGSTKCAVGALGTVVFGLATGAIVADDVSGVLIGDDAALAATVPLTAASGVFAVNGAKEASEGISEAIDGIKDSIPEGRWRIRRPDGFQTEIHSGHGHFDKKTGQKEDPHTHELLPRSQQDPKSVEDPLYKDKNAHKTTDNEKKLLEEQNGTK